MGDNKRLDWVDQTRGFLFLLVIICHTRLASSWLQSFYNPIFLAGFFFLSGYLYKDKPIKEKITSIINGLVAPFVIYCLLWGGIRIAQTHSLADGITMVIDCFMGGDSIWFIPCLILVEFLYVSIKKAVPYADYLILTLSAFLYFLVTLLEVSKGFWCWSVAVYAIGYYSLGHFFQRKLLSHNKSLTLMLLYLFFCSICWSLQYLVPVDMHQNHFSSPICFLLMSIIGCVALVSLMQYVPTNKYLVEFGRYTLFLFPFHGLVLRNLLKVFGGDMFGESNTMIIVVFFTFVICLLLARYVYRYMPAFGGKKKWFKIN